MSVESILAQGRRRRVALMRSTVRITRPGGEPVFNPATGQYETPPEATIYEGPCQIKPTFSPAERDGSSADREVVVQSYDLALPWAEANSVESVDVHDVAEILSGDDPWAIGKRFPVAWVEHADTRTHRRITVFAQDRGAATHG